MKKRLYKDKETAVVSGVMSGIAQYFGIDPTVVRVAYVLLCALIIRIIPGIIIYLVLAFIMPEKNDIGFDDYEVK